MGYHEVSERGFLRGLTARFVFLLDDDLGGLDLRGGSSSLRSE